MCSVKYDVGISINFQKSSKMVDSKDLNKEAVTINTKYHYHKQQVHMRDEYIKQHQLRPSSMLWRELSKSNVNVNEFTLNGSIAQTRKIVTRKLDTSLVCECNKQP
ncbi:hypothetical protein GJ496_007805 [Pomphorhynchus laevis]|nr:hypothetical protein GJ496_007805 [Pomphorhynchus laevis]